MKTAVEWLYKNLLDNPISNEDVIYNINVLEQAKKMEKQQIIYAYRKGKVNGIESRIDGEPNIPAEDYYNKTFKNE